MVDRKIGRILGGDAGGGAAAMAGAATVASVEAAVATAEAAKARAEVVDKGKKWQGCCGARRTRRSPRRS